MKPTALLLSTLGALHFGCVLLAGPAGTNLLANPGFELGLTGWTTDHGAIRQTNPPPHEGTNYLMGAIDGAGSSYTYQTIDLLVAGFTPNELDSLPFEVHFGGWQAGWETQTDSGRIEVILADGTNEISRVDLGWFYSNMTWSLKEGSLPLPPATRTITFGFYALRRSGANNDAYLDDAFLVVAPQRSHIAAIDLAGSSVSLQITNLYPGLSYGVVRDQELPGATWIERGAFVAESPSTNWSELVDPVPVPAAFYRVLLKP